jgi:glycosyltransferase involved in cell wall biosynthesis
VPVRIGSRRGFVETPGLQRVQKVAYAAAHRIVANSLAAAARLRAEGIPGQKVTLIPNGIDPTIFPRRTYAERPRRIATVACLREEKRLDVLIEASARVLARYPDAEFLIAGDGPCRDELLELARRAGVVDRVRFLGHRDDVPGFLADADVFVLPSRSDASPNSIIEAMASGLPVIASAVGGIPEIVDHDKTGWLVPSGDPDALANAVLEMLAAPGRAADFGRAGRLKTERVYSFDRMVERFEALYLHELGDRRALQPGRQVA